MEVRAAREEVPGGGVCFQWKARWLRIQGGARVHTQPACRTRLPSPDLCARGRMRRESGGGPCAPESQVQGAVHADLKAPRVFSSPPISLQSPLPAPPARGSAARSARRRRRRRRRTGGMGEGVVGVRASEESAEAAPASIGVRARRALSGSSVPCLPAHHAPTPSLFTV